MSAVLVTGPTVMQNTPFLPIAVVVTVPISPTHRGWLGWVGLGRWFNTGMVRTRLEPADGQPSQY